MDNFAIKYTNQTDALHLMSALKAHYAISKDWDATCYCGLTIGWDYIRCMVDLSMPTYISNEPSIASVIHCWHKLSTPHMPGKSPNMAPKSNLLMALALHQSLMLLTPSTSKK